MMKKQFILLVMMLMCIQLSADAVKIDGINYDFNTSDKIATVTSNSPKYSGDIVIPESVEYNGEKYSVTSIGYEAFYNCRGLTSVTIPNSVTSIGQGAFYGCSGLTSVTIPNSVTIIGYQAFCGCSGLTSVTIPNSVTSIGGYAFYGCSGLTSVMVLCSPSSIEDYVFGNCSKLKEVTFDCESVTKIFKSCDSIEKITLTGNVTSIGYEAFSGCRGLTSVTIPNSVTSIGRFAFDGCRALTSLIIGSGVTSIGSDAFYNTNLKKTIWLTNTPPSGAINASGAVNYVSNDQFTSLRNTVKYQFLSSNFVVDGIRYVPISPSERTCDAIDHTNDSHQKEIIINSTVTYKNIALNVKNIGPYLLCDNKFVENVSLNGDFTSIPEGTFMGCSLLNGIVVPKTVNEIGNYTFQGCNNLKNVIMLDSETSLTLGSNGSSPLFADCPLDSVYIGRDISYGKEQYNGYSPFYRNTSLRAVKITDKETEISTNEFYGCTNLQRIIIGDGVTSIGDWAFSGCASLKFFAFGSQVTTIGKEAFSDCMAVVEISSKAATPPTCGTQALDDINKWECQLFVPQGCLAAYQAADQWKDFFFTQEGEGTAGQGDNPVNPDDKKCATPTVSLTGGKLSFSCKTEDVVYHYSIAHADVKEGTATGSIDLTNTYIISVYASKDGYENSETARTEIKVESGSGTIGDINGDGKVDIVDVTTLIDMILSAK